MAILAALKRMFLDELRQNLEVLAQEKRAARAPTAEVPSELLADLEKLQKRLAAIDPVTTFPLSSESERPTGTDFDGVARVVSELEFYKRRSQEYFALIQKIEVQREEWKSLYFRDSQGHQQAQALLQETIIQLRQQVIGALKTVNDYRKEKGEPQIELKAFDPKAPPVGIAEATAKRNAYDLAKVSPQIDHASAVQAIDQAMPPPDGVTDVSHGVT